ncbi:MAG: hypothetical protein HY897_24155 [Deltaproteobacteria bacterium]|nr:hypothetical protein [Deltaproteobacteria bacterium]
MTEIVLRNVSRTARFCIATVILFCGLAACVAPTPPPSFSLSKFARPSRSAGAEAPGGKITASASSLTIDGTGGRSTLVPLPGAAVALWLGDHYDLAFGVSDLQLTTEGNLWFGSDDVRVGLLHGIGLGAILSDENSHQDSESTLIIDLAAGLFGQVRLSEHASGFAGFKYVYCTTKGDNEAIDSVDYFGGSFGVVFTAGRLEIAPELSIVSARPRNDTNPDVTGAIAKDFMVYVPTLNLSASF